MAKRKPTKEEAKRRLDELPIIPNIRLPLGGPSLGELATAFIEEDPLGRTGPGDVIIRSRPMQGPSKQRFLDETALMQAMVNDPSFKLSKEQVDLINDDTRMLADTGMGLVEINGRDVIRRSGQFRRDMLLPRTNQKRKRKKTKTDKTMSKALAQANKELRKKNGQLRAGVTQADIMRRAHRLRRRMS